jgi:hypothetical protein
MRLLSASESLFRLNYMTAAEVARRIGVRDTTIYDWLLGRARPAEPKRIAAFLGTVGRRRKSAKARASSARGLRRPDSQFCRESRVTGIPVLFSTLTASDWLKPFCSRQRFRLLISGRGFCGMKV